MVSTKLELVGHIWKNVDSSVDFSWIDEKWVIFCHAKGGEQTVIAKIKADSVDEKSDVFHVIDNIKQKIFKLSALSTFYYECQLVRFCITFLLPYYWLVKNKNTEKKKTAEENKKFVLLFYCSRES